METHTQSGTVIKWRSAYTSLSKAASKPAIKREQAPSTLISILFAALRIMYCSVCVVRKALVLRHQWVRTEAIGEQRTHIASIWKEKRWKQTYNASHSQHFSRTIRTNLLLDREKIHSIVNFFWHSLSFVLVFFFSIKLNWNFHSWKSVEVVLCRKSQMNKTKTRIWCFCVCESWRKIWSNICVFSHRVSCAPRYMFDNGNDGHGKFLENSLGSMKIDGKIEIIAKITI